LSGGGTIKQVAARFGVGQATLKRWLWRVRSGEGLKPRKAPGREREFTAEHDQMLKRLVEERSDRSTIEFADLLADDCGREFSRETVRTALHRLKLSRKKNGARR